VIKSGQGEWSMKAVEGGGKCYPEERWLDWKRVTRMEVWMGV
jgi:hypothetical protein